MATVLKLRRGTTAQNDSFTGAAGEIVFDTDRNELRLHDGSTAGGFVIQNSSTSSGVNGLTYTAANNTLEISTPGGDTYTATISLFAGDDVDIGNANTDTLTINSRIDSNLVPAANVTYDLGTSTHRWKDIWLSGSTINLGTATITAEANGAVTLPAGSGISGQTDLVTETQLNDRMQVANVNVLVSDRMQVANVQSLIANETANSDSKFATWGALTSTNTSIRSAISTEVSNLVDSAPATLDTLNELAAALGDDANFATTLTTNLGQKLGATATVTLTGDITAGATAFSSNAVSLSTTIANTMTSGSIHGGATQVPIIRVNNKGQVIGISNTTVAGVTGVTFTSANSNLRVSVADGTTYDTEIGAGVSAFDYYSANSTFVITNSDSTSFEAEIPQGFTQSTIVEFPTGDYQGTDNYIGETDTLDAFGVAVAPLFDCMEPQGSTATEDLGGL